MFPKDNPESWKEIYEFIGEFPDDEYWSKWKPMVRDVVLDLEARGLNKSFRIGQSMHDIIFSTVDRRLTSEPRVTLIFHPEEQTVRILYSSWSLLYKPPISEETVHRSASLSPILNYLRRLWAETKPGSSLPEALLASE